MFRCCEGGVEGMGEMECLVSMFLKDRGESKELQVHLAQGMVGWSTQARWGKTSCPNVTGTELVYAGRAGGSWWSHTEGVANYVCMPNDADYLQYSPGVQGLAQPCAWS